ncbi:MAG: hypothetical protein V4724_31405 [Pseudomonadota bacterium]
MANPEQDNQDTSPGTTPAPLAAPFPGAARRRFARAGLAATGVLLTVKSQPGMACSICVTPSGFQSSLTGSPNLHAPNTCLGQTPKTWYDNRNTNGYWPVNKATKFQDVFSTRTSDTTQTLATLMSVTNPATQNAQIMKYLSANYLNMASGKMPFLTMEILNRIWTGWCSTSKSYTPSAGANAWGYNEIILYLTGTT